MEDTEALCDAVISPRSKAASAVVSNKPRIAVDVICKSFLSSKNLVTLRPIFLSLSPSNVRNNELVG